MRKCVIAVPARLPPADDADPVRAAADVRRADRRAQGHLPPRRHHPRRQGEDLSIHMVKGVPPIRQSQVSAVKNRFLGCVKSHITARLFTLPSLGFCFLVEPWIQNWYDIRD